MKRLLVLVLILCIVIVAGCSNAIDDYGDADVAIVIKGEEITVGELRFLFLDEQVMDNLDGIIQFTLAKQEVEKLQIDMTEQLQEIDENIEFTLDNAFSTENQTIANSREFIESQANKLGMNEKEYHERYLEKTQEMSIFVTTYIEEKLGEMGPNAESYVEQANQLLEDLVKKNEDEIEVLIN